MSETKRKPKPGANGKPRKPRQKQGYLVEDMEPPHIDEIDQAAEDYVAARDARMRMGEQEQQLQSDLLGMMHKHGLKHYEYGGRVVAVEGLEKVKVRKAKQEKVEVE